MENKYTREKLLREVAPHLEKTSASFFIWILFLLGVIALGVYA